MAVSDDSCCSALEPSGVWHVGTWTSSPYAASSGYSEKERLSYLDLLESKTQGRACSTPGEETVEMAEWYPPPSVHFTESLWEHHSLLVRWWYNDALSRSSVGRGSVLFNVLQCFNSCFWIRPPQKTFNPSEHILALRLSLVSGQIWTVLNYQ